MSIEPKLWTVFLAGQYVDGELVLEIDDRLKSFGQKVMVAVEDYEQLRAERDEADRRAGAAERNAEQLADERRAREAWKTKAKAAWGVDDRVSFDVVWAQALEARAQLKVQYRILDELEDSFDQQTYTEKSREDFDAPDDREYSVNITAKQLRAISAALATIKVDS